MTLRRATAAAIVTELGRLVASLCQTNEQGVRLNRMWGHVGQASQEVVSGCPPGVLSTGFPAALAQFDVERVWSRLRHAHQYVGIDP